ncbi:hypothetical protein NDU88_009095 [Pleurodeles waltl]|uniref:Secreted protein n=1 Tax=Pleurodeles waltl TaxID=8319 RepID=A0AAV7RZG9_PLEWA|nr:hypothetical protein NDU88_009095 [Pleurodeles waltl]
MCVIIAVAEFRGRSGVLAVFCAAVPGSRAKSPQRTAEEEIRGNKGLCVDFSGHTQRCIVQFSCRDSCVSISGARSWILFGLRGFQTPRGRCVNFLRWQDEDTGAASLQWALH